MGGKRGRWWIPVGSGLLFGLTAATHVFAYMADFDRVLGAPLWQQSFLAFYGPWQGLWWLWKWGWRAPHAFELPGLVGLVVLGLTWIALGSMQQRHTTAQAHFATRRELQQAECLSKTGIVLGKLR